MSVRIGEILGAAIGKVVKVDCDPSGSCVGEFLRIKVRVDVSMPFKRGLQVRLIDAE